MNGVKISWGKDERPKARMIHFMNGMIGMDRMVG
jgi:hypothetical protein